jgi:hypothetical protein
MNLSQQVFVVFYAILWGTLANALPRWKAFDTGNWRRYERARRRFYWSTLCLDILPVIYFSLLWFAFLNRPLWNLVGCGWPETAKSVVKIVAVGLSALAPFGFYRVWLFRVQRNPDHFYPPECSEEWTQSGLHINRQVDLNRSGANPNLCFGLLYIIGVPSLCGVLPTLILG